MLFLHSDWIIELYATEIVNNPVNKYHIILAIKNFICIKSCNANNPNQQFITNQINSLDKYNAPITDKNNSSYLLKDSKNTQFGFYVVNPSTANDQCLQLNNDGISVMPCNMDSSQRFGTNYNTVL